MRRPRLMWCLGAALTLLASCRHAPDSGGPTGVVRYESRELTNVQVTFHRATSQGFEKAAIGLTQSDGKFQLRSPDGNPLALPPGQYRVTLEHVGDTTWSFTSPFAKPETSPLDFTRDGATSELVVEPPPNSIVVTR